VLASSGGANADPGIRKQIASDAKAMETTDDSFTDKLLFSSPGPDKGAPLDADAEAQRIQNAKAQGQQTATGTSLNGTTPGSTTPPSKPTDSATIKKDSDGGFDGIF
jgi:hypothetical protein